MAAYLIGEGRVGSNHKNSWIFSCATQFRDGVDHTGEWVKRGYWYPAQKIAVLSENVWANASFTVKVKDDPAYQFYPNPNAISEQSVEFSLPLRPIIAAIPSCISMGMACVATNGVAFSMAWTRRGETRWPMRCKTDAPNTRSVIVIANTTTTARVVAIPIPKRRLIRWLALR